MEVLKEKMITLPVVAVPQPNGQYTTGTNVCDTKVG